MSGVSEGRLRHGRLVWRRRILIGGAALLLASAAGGPSYAGRLAAALNLDTLLAGRSPGSRGKVELVKRPVPAPAPLQREARVAPRTRAGLAAEPASLSDPLPAAAIEPELLTPAGLTVASPDIADQSGNRGQHAPSFALEAVDHGFMGAGAAGIGIGVPPEPLTTRAELEPQWISPELSAGVPEPETWATLILGFSLMGLRARALRQSSSIKAARSSDAV